MQMHKTASPWQFYCSELKGCRNMQNFQIVNRILLGMFAGVLPAILAEDGGETREKIEREYNVFKYRGNFDLEMFIFSCLSVQRLVTTWPNCLSITGLTHRHTPEIKYPIQPACFWTGGRNWSTSRKPI